ncbi:MAG TPA: YXWGXW repeat-containing protein [Terriglobales bacterium]|nr:YXWGXW repeat-containing protein [Terriglobales bacterium]
MRVLWPIRSLLLLLVILILSAASFGQIAISVRFAPPALPVYEQPVCPGEDYIWTPGYWAFDSVIGDYYWVPGTWVLAPQVGYLWTPPWWEWNGAAYIFHDGYWGPRVGFYGGIPYGFGYFGHGYEGGRWEGEHFFYNRSVTNINVTNIRYVYNTTVVRNVSVNRVSYNGGNGGIEARPTPEEEAARRERHLPPTALQTQHFAAAHSNPQLRASENRGRPPVAATMRPATFGEHETVPAREAGAPYRRDVEHGNVPVPGGDIPRTSTPIHAKELPPHPRPPAPNTGNPGMDRKYQQQQDKLYAKQDQERQKLEQKQERDHERLTQQNANEARRQQVEQQHQHQTQQMEQKHTQQWGHLQAQQQQPGKK